MAKIFGRLYSSFRLPQKIMASSQKSFHKNSNNNSVKCRTICNSNYLLSLNKLMFKSPFPGNGSLYTCYSNYCCLITKVDVRHYCTTKQKTTENSEKPQETRPTLLQQFKQMYRDYWYVLLPVHLATSSVWLGSFYYLAKSGVDIVSILEAIGAGEKLVEKLRNGNSTMGYVAISYALYKIATPLRYTVTLGGTTISIKYLKDWGYIKPIPPKEKIKETIQKKKKNFNELIEKEKSTFLKDKTGFYNYIFPFKLKKMGKSKDSDK